LTPTPSPSSTNLAGVGASTMAASGSASASGTMTPSSVPLASYPATAMPTTASPAAWAGGTKSASLSAGAASSGTAASPQTTALASVPATGPYDPNGYRPNSSFGAGATGTAGTGSSIADRYASTGPGPIGQHATDSTRGMIGSSIATAGDRYAPSANALAAPIAGPTPSTQFDRYAMGSAAVASSPGPSDRYGESLRENRTSTSTTGLGSNHTPPDITATSDPAVPPSATPTTSKSLTAAPISRATAPPWSSQAGQYRPGGTSSYSVGEAKAHVEIATRPSSPASSNWPTATSPTRTSDPWAPPTSPPTSTDTRAL
jgi:hypothetical protein